MRCRSYLWNISFFISTAKIQQFSETTKFIELKNVKRICNTIIYYRYVEYEGHLINFKYAQTKTEFSVELYIKSVCNCLAVSNRRGVDVSDCNLWRLFIKVVLYLMPSFLKIQLFQRLDYCIALWLNVVFFTLKINVHNLNF